jgi:hypothetical protein
MTPTGVCRQCGKDIDPVANGTYYLVQGWAQRRGSTGGANQIVMAHELGAYLHRLCMDEVRRGVLKGQAVMFQ